ncbi:Osmotically inducible protein OsmY [Enhygromyxa salina]|uniref:Osmotically inducible protein OsmY n=1 Tax=Enhygromyxa salina TaxID=215803 RepID=A0A0C1ZP04_9BACT|nr:BON domain-containing protein [Enhygromyxa salina]KIG19199.1 Osmotically inducible protein OsmY [Enhygromyxa salina]
MKRIISIPLLPLLILLAPVGLSACATTQTVSAQTDDSALASRVGRRLSADPDVSRFDIDVDALNGVVTLRGQVEDQATADTAARVAESTTGVKKVINKLMLESDPDNPGSSRNDAAISAAVGARLLGDPEVRRFNIDVDVVEGVVYLSGIVEDKLAKDTAERIASAVDGVVRVDNELEVDDMEHEGHEESP